MGSRREADELGRRRAAALVRRSGDEVRTGRLASGVSQARAARESGMSRSQLGRIERGELPGLSVEQACRVATVLGLAVRLMTYPDGDPVRDAGQLRLEGRLRRVVPSAAGWQTEVPMPIPGDRRAWDVMLALAGRRAGCECEQKLSDVQALARRLALKLRDGGVDVLILVVADTAGNRRFLRDHREDLRVLLPLDSRAILAAFRDGRLPSANGILVL